MAFIERNERLVEFGAPILLLSCSAVSLYVFRFHLDVHHQVSHHWKIAAGYLVATSLIGMGTIRYLRINEWRKHALNVSVKWTLRTVSTVILFNSFASPFYSLAAMAVLVLSYGIYSVVKLLSPTDQDKLVADWSKAIKRD